MEGEDMNSGSEILSALEKRKEKVGTMHLTYPDYFLVPLFKLGARTTSS